MTIKPYITRTKIITEARSQGHVVLPNGSSTTIDTGSTVFHVGEDGILDANGKEIAPEDAMNIVKSQPTA